MKFFFIHDEAGCIHNAGQCADDELEIQPVAEGMTIREGEASPFADYFDGEAVIAKPARPSPMHAWDWTTKAWTDPRTLADLKSAKREQINREWAQANLTGFMFGGKRIGTDALDRSNIDAINGSIALMQALPADWVGGWKTADNSYVVISNVDEWKSFYAAMVAQGQANFTHAQTLKGQIDAATASELETINWATNG